MPINRRTLQRSAVAAPAIIKLWPALIREAKAICTPTGLGPSFAEVGALPQILQLPNPFVLNDGTPIITKVQWQQKRAEIKQIVQYYEVGHFPPPSPVSVVSIDVDETITTTQGTMNHKHVNLQTGPAGALPFSMNLYIPQNSGSGPLPALLTGEMAWSPVIATPIAGRDACLGPDNLNVLVNRGFIICEFSRDDFSLDWNDDGGDVIFSSRLYPLYPFDRSTNGLGGVTGYDWGHQAAWHWGFMRAVDYLFSLSYVDKNKVGVTGISRGSGAPVSAAIFDERIAASLPNQEGPGQTRYMEQDDPNRGRTGGNGGYAPRRSTFTGGSTSVTCLGAQKSITSNNAELPFDQNIYMVGCAPRAFYICDSLIWNTANPRGTAQGFLAGRQAWTALGAPTSRCQIMYSDINTTSSGGHEMTYTYWKAMLDFLDFIYHGTALPADNLAPGSISTFTIPRGSPVFSGLPQAYNWSTPILT
jgi:hypothetical protein